MKSKNITHSKYRNSGVLFELLVRQVTSDTLAGKPISEALTILKKYFNTSTELGKEVQLYRAFFEGKALTEGRALDFIDMVVEQRKKLDERKLAREKFNLVKEIKAAYSLKEFLGAKVQNYTVNASIYKTFMTEVAKDTSYKVVNINEVSEARFTLVEHLMVRGTTKKTTAPNPLMEEFRQQSEDLRLLAFKFVIDRFNQKYSNLNDKQKSLLREYINNVSDNNSLTEYVRREVPNVKSALIARAQKMSDKVMAIKITEVASQLDNIGNKRTIKDSEITALMIAYEILKEAAL